MTLPTRIATAPRSREIFLVVGNTGFSPPQLLRSSRLYEVDPSPALRATAVWPKRIESNFSRCAATHPPEGKATHCAPLTRSPLPCEQGRVNVFGEAAGPQCFTQLPDVRDHPAPVISSGGIMLHEDTAKITTASRSREIFLVVGNTGFSPPQLLRSSRLFEADPSPGLWPSAVWPKRKAFDGQAKRLLYSGQTWTSYAGCPSLRGNLLTGILNSWGNPPECRPLEKGRAKGAGWIDGITLESSAVRQPTHPKGKRLTAFSVACGSLQHGYQRLTTI